MELNQLGFSQRVTFGRRSHEQAEVIYTNPDKNISREIVNESGTICDFPGFAYPEVVEYYIEGSCPDPIIYYRTAFERVDSERYLMIWMIQPDGRFWEDEDGFGSTNDAEIRLYAFLNDEGKFISKFQLYNVGVKKFFGTDLEMQESREIAEKKAF